MEILRSRSYNTSCFQSTSKYFSKPSKLQKASFGNEVIKNVHNRDCKSLKDLISCGLSPNPCNQFGDSLLNTVCKRGYQDIFHTFMECGASISTTDQFGRTPLHFACWSSNNSFSIVEKIISLDVNMLRATDKVGKTPLDYVSSDKWDEWNQFLKEKEEIFWPKDSADTALVCTYDAMECSILPDPVNAMSEDMAKRVSSGSFRLKNNL
jgi:ankyrin repeat protein